MGTKSFGAGFLLGRRNTLKLRSGDACTASDSTSCSGMAQFKIKTITFNDNIINHTVKSNRKKFKKSEVQVSKFWSDRKFWFNKQL